MDRSEFKKIVSAIMLEHPFYGTLLSKIRVEASNEIQTIAMTDGKKIVVNPEKFMKLDAKERIGVLIHELHHIIELHPLRRRELMKKYPMEAIVYNIVEDAKINQHISNDFKLPSTAIRPHDVERLFDVHNVEKKSYEEIIAEIYKFSKYSSDAVGSCSVSAQQRDVDVSVEPLPGGEVINEGSGEISNAENDDLLGEAVKKAVMDSYITAKQIGKMPAWLERLVKELTKSKVPWRRLLRVAIDAAIGEEVYRTYTRPSKKSWLSESDVDLPSKRTFGFERIAVLIDTSGSISEDELKQFISEVHTIFKESSKEIIVIPWDARAYTPVRIRNADDIKNLRLYGGGGTIIKDALFKALKLKPDVTIIFSDFDIYDIDSDDVQQMLRTLAKNGKLIMVTTHTEPPRIPRSVSVKLELR